MCGICGKYSPAGVRQEELDDMLEAIAHRGPDDEGFYVNGAIGLGSRRLSIIDLISGHQPICNEDKTIWIVYNGEIYNYKKLRHDLQKKGHIFQTNSDTEVIVHLYEDYGERCVEKLSGMFAFSIWDERQQKLFLARDRNGQKPLFYSQHNGEFYFASEIKAILAANRQPREIDYESFHHYLSLRFIPSPNTMLRHIKKLPPAHILIWQHGKTYISCYWHLSFREKLNLPDSELIEGLEEKLRQTIDSHLVSDVPAGAFLSGGMDTSMIVAFMAENLKTSFKTFAIGVKEQSFNELPYARIIAQTFQTDHFEQKVEADIINLLPKIIWHLDEPSDPIAACQFYAAELAAKHVKVVVGGDGGDELFAGFDRYWGVGYIGYYNLIPRFIRRKIIANILEQLPENFEYKSLTQRMRWVNQLSKLPNLGDRYAEATCFFRFNHREKQELFDTDLWNRLEQISSADIITSQYNNADAVDPIDKMLYADYMTRLPEHSLLLADRMTMAHGLELRSPYLDHDLIEFMAAFPSNMKIRGRRLKYVLRQIARDYLPEEILRRVKQGFMFPVAFWFRDQLYYFIKAFLLDSHFVKEGIFKKKYVEQLIENHHNRHVDNHVRLWMLMNLEIWHQIYIDQISLETIGERIKSNIRRT